MVSGAFEERFSEHLLRIKQNGHRALIYQFDAHHLLEAAGFAAQASRLNFLDEEFIKPPSWLRRRSRVKRWSFSPSDIAIQSELRDSQHSAAHVSYAEVHSAAFVFKDAQARDLLSQVVRICLGVFLPDTQQNQQSQPDFAGR